LAADLSRQTDLTVACFYPWFSLDYSHFRRAFLRNCALFSAAGGQYFICARLPRRAGDFFNADAIPGVQTGDYRGGGRWEFARLSLAFCCQRFLPNVWVVPPVRPRSKYAITFGAALVGLLMIVFLTFNHTLGVAAREADPEVLRRETLVPSGLNFLGIFCGEKMPGQ